METLVTSYNKVNMPKIEKAIKEILLAIGENPDREGLKDTPKRVARFWKEFIDYDPGEISTSFSENIDDGTVELQGMRVWSLCEHHLLPFYVDVSVAYKPNGKILGISKIARICQQKAHKLQLQERFVVEVMEEIKKQTGSNNIKVSAKGQHTCMTMRGIKMQSDIVTTVSCGHP